MVRLVLLQTRESLFAQLAMLTQMPLDGVSTMTGLQSPENAEDIATELLDGLNSLPVECVSPPVYFWLLQCRAGWPGLMMIGRYERSIAGAESPIHRYSIDGMFSLTFTDYRPSVSFHEDRI